MSTTQTRTSLNEQRRVHILNELRGLADKIKLCKTVKQKRFYGYKMGHLKKKLEKLDVSYKEFELKKKEEKEKIDNFWKNLKTRMG